MNSFESEKEDMKEDEVQEDVQQDQDAQETENEAAEVTLSKKEHDELLAQVAEFENAKDKLLRTAADFENAKKRHARDRDEAIKYSQESIVRELLPIVDNFERALAHSSEFEDPKAKNLVTGIQMVLKQFVEVMKKNGLVRVETVGKPFDPNFHEALAHVEEEGPEDEIVDEIEPGYMLHGKLLRAAKVRVRTAPSNKEDS